MAMARRLFRPLGGIAKRVLLQQPVMFNLSRNYISEMRKEAFEENILRLLRYEIRYELERSPPSQVKSNDFFFPGITLVSGPAWAHSTIPRIPATSHQQQPITEFDSFIIDERPGEQWIKLNKKFGENEEIRVEVTMFDASVPVKKGGDVSAADDVHLHITMIVNVLKGESNDVLEFVCSAWPNSVEIRKVYTRGQKGIVDQPYVGPPFKELDDELQNSLYDFLETRGINDGLSVFLHQYMKNKDKLEFIRWMEKAKSFIERK
ncbi:uncharacterized protein At2g39795, mitochondrial isoform X1 [Lycium barbarum]|uniref:uncharacterized protein At2g39795, mitochondrial isoform X1 n=1 Tax=Lycium barbarum TaxID=112863 RepID=UPI00293E2AF3|nr:uncharacterized protein At2g39795, mitochondrial isoform X1 [Lycium barbarum]